MKKLLLVIAIILALTTLLASCDVLYPQGGSDANNGINNGTNNEENNGNVDPSKQPQHIGLNFRTYPDRDECVVSLRLCALCEDRTKCYIRDIEIPETSPDGAKVVDVQNFNNAYVESVILPNTIIKIYDSAFEGASSLKSIEIPASVKEIGWKAFKDCISLETVTFAEDCELERIISGAFENTNIKSIVIPDGLTRLNGTLVGCAALETAVIPSSVTALDTTFMRCTSLESIVLPKSVTKINAYLFAEGKVPTDVYYTGSAEEFNSIVVYNFVDNVVDESISISEIFAGATIHYNYVPEN